MKQNLKNFLIILSLSILIFLPYLVKIHYATDTYTVSNMGYINYSLNYSFLDGRFITGLTFLICNFFKLNINYLVIISEILAIIINSITVFLIYNYILKNTSNKKNNFFVLLIAFFTIWNFTYIENMHFLECYVLALSVLFYYFAASKAYEKKFLSSGIFMFLGLISYQGTIGVLFAFLFLFILTNKSKNNLSFKNFFIPFILTVFINFILEMALVKASSTIIRKRTIKNIKYFSKYIVNNI